MSKDGKAKRPARKQQDKPEAARRKVGRPTLYRAEYADLAFKFCLLGATDAELAEFFDVDVQTINRWKAAHPEFSHSMTRGKDRADAEVAEKLYRRALGYQHEAVKMFQAGGEIISEKYTEHYPPDTQAASLWLRNRQPRKWRDKIDHQHTGVDGGPIEHGITVRFVRPETKPSE